MDPLAEPADELPQQRPFWFWWAVGGGALFGSLVAFAVWRVSFTEPEKPSPVEPGQDPAKTVKVERKADFEKPILRSLPSEGGAGEEMYFKPGHWSNLLVELKANNDDFRGSLWSDPADLPGVPFSLHSARDVVLPKGDRRFMEWLSYLPPEKVEQEETYQPKVRRVGVHLGGRALGTASVSHDALFRPLAEHQFYFVALAREPDSYKYLDHLLSAAGVMGTTPTLYDRTYLVKRMGGASRISLPANPLAWTSIAYLLWDDVDPTEVADHQAAILDWLHWGGQLIVSGPDTLQLLRGSFLDPYLPASGTATIDLPDRAFVELATTWGAKNRVALVTSGWSGVRLTLDEKSPYSYVPESGDLLVERRVGAGRIVVSAFRLSSPRFIAWQSSGPDSLFNACLLRRPLRFIVPEGEHILRDTFVHANSAPAQVASQVRYLSRDAGAAPNRRQNVDVPRIEGGGEGWLGGWFDAQLRKFGPGVAGWSDDSLLARAARSELRKASAIEAPQAATVLVAILVYVMALVPVNWFVFRLLRRVEWAWIAVPILAIGATIGVAYFTELDIGFARARTEIGVLEFHADYPRAHLTRYVALYNSLASQYQIGLEDGQALIQPFASEDKPKLLPGQTRHPLALHLGEEQADDGEVTRVRLDGFAIASAATRFLHVEQMYDAGGGLRWEPSQDGTGWRIVNGTRLALRDARLVQEDGGLWKTAWIGDLEPGGARRAEFEEEPPDVVIERRRRSSRPLDQAGEISLARLTKAAEQACDDGALRLIAWTEDSLPGMRVQPPPSANAVKQAHLVVANLQQPPWPAPAADRFARTVPFDP